MFCLKYVCTFLVFLCSCNLISAAIPSYITVCHQSDPKLTACIKNSVEQLRPQLRNGIKELDVPALEPLNIDDVFISRGNGQYRFQLNLTGIEVIGASDFQLNKLKLDVPNMIYKMGVTFPSIHLKGNYAVDTRILSLPIVANGQFNANATNTAGVGILKGSLVRDEFEHMQFSDLSINLKIGDYSLHLENIGAGDADLNGAINEIANTNKDELITISTPYIERKASEILLKFANKIVSHLPYDEVFPK